MIFFLVFSGESLSGYHLVPIKPHEIVSKVKIMLYFGPNEFFLTKITKKSMFKAVTARKCSNLYSKRATFDRYHHKSPHRNANALQSTVIVDEAPILLTPRTKKRKSNIDCDIFW